MLAIRSVAVRAGARKRRKGVRAKREVWAEHDLVMGTGLLGGRIQRLWAGSNRFVLHDAPWTGCEAKLFSSRAAGLVYSLSKR